MGNEMAAFMGIGGRSRVAQGQFQAQLIVDIGGLLVQVAKDLLLLALILGIDMVADLGFEVRGDLGTVPHQVALESLVHMAQI